MRLDIPYGGAAVPLVLPDDARVYRPNDVAARDEEALLAAALSRTLGTPPVADFVRGARDLLVVVNDATRPTPTGRVLARLWPHLPAGRTSFLVATGNHRAPTEDEFRQIFGPLYCEPKGRVWVHDAGDDAAHAPAGRTPRGTELFFHRAALEAERLLVIGSVEPHYFAGYTGGRKAFLPGVAARRTIEQNHRHAMSPAAEVLALAGNPVHEDMMDAAAPFVARPHVAIMTVLDRDHRIYAAAAGQLHDAFHAAVPAANEVYAVAAAGPADVVVAVAPFPMDIDLYQSHKAVENAKRLMADGGVIILVSACRMGLGDRAFWEVLASCRTPAQVAARVGDGYEVGWHKATRLAELLGRGDVWAVTTLDDDVLSRAFIRPYRDVQHALDDALAARPAGSRVAVLLDASLAVPVIT